MDIDAPGQNPEPETQEPVTQTETVTEEPKKRRSPKKLLAVLAVLLLIAAAVYGAYWWRGQELKELRSDKDSKISELEQKVQTLEAAEAEMETPQHEETEMTAAMMAETIQEAVEAGDFAALEAHMADTVRVILAASEGVGDRTPTQAVSDMKYLDSATDPWNFALTEETLNEWATGDYAQYFPGSAVVGRSANDYVVSFTFDAAGEISGVFMANNADSL